MGRSRITATTWTAFIFAVYVFVRFRVQVPRWDDILVKAKAPA